MPPDERRYWQQLRAKPPSKAEMKKMLDEKKLQQMQDKEQNNQGKQPVLLGVEYDVEALHEEIKDLKRQIELFRGDEPVSLTGIPQDERFHT